MEADASFSLQHLVQICPSGPSFHKGAAHPCNVIPQGGCPSLDLDTTHVPSIIHYKTLGKTATAMGGATRMSTCPDGCLQAVVFDAIPLCTRHTDRAAYTVLHTALGGAVSRAGTMGSLE